MIFVNTYFHNKVNMLCYYLCFLTWWPCSTLKPKTNIAILWFCQSHQKCCFLWYNTFSIFHQNVAHWHYCKCHFVFFVVELSLCFNLSALFILRDSKKFLQRNPSSSCMDLHVVRATVFTKYSLLCVNYVWSLNINWCSFSITLHTVNNSCVNGDW